MWTSELRGRGERMIVYLRLRISAEDYDNIMSFCGGGTTCLARCGWGQGNAGGTTFLASYTKAVGSIHVKARARAHTAAENMAGRRQMNMLWKKYFRDPSLWWDHRNIKENSAFPDFKHKITQESLWMDGRNNPLWVSEELRRRGLLMSSTAAEDGKDFKSMSRPLLASLKACGKRKDLSEGIRLHADIRTSGLLEKDPYLGNTLVSMYAKCGALTRAQQILQELPVRDIVAWSALIAGYTQHGQGEMALNCYKRMRSEGLSPDAFTYACILKACGITGAVDRGRQIHDEIVTKGLLGKDVVLGNALVNMYAKCGALTKAQEVLLELPIRDVVSWSALIAGYAQQGQGVEALDCYDRMQTEGLSPNAITYTCILKACGITRAVDRGKEIHDEIVSRGLLRRDVVLGTALVDMYAKCGVLTRAQQVFDELPVRNVVSWSALIAGYVLKGQGEEALNCYEKMQSEGLSPDAITYSCILKACGITGAVNRGKQIHDEIVDKGILGKYVVLGTALVDMYAKCGVLTKAQEVLDGLLVRNVVSWNALIAGYAQQGQGREAMDCFLRMQTEGFTPDTVSWNALIGGFSIQGKADEALGCFEWMQREGFSPDAITFVGVLNACSHSGLVDKGQTYFEKMMKTYGIQPDVELHTCMIDLFGRAGHFDKALTVIKKMPSSDHLPVWSALLGACRKWGNVELGRVAFEHAIQLDDHDASAYVCMENIYAAAGLQEDAQEIEAMRVKRAAWKKPGRSWWVDDETGDVHSFVVRDTKHAQIKSIDAKLQDIALNISQEGYSTSLHWVSQNISDDAKDVLCRHSEKLAIACALINTSEGKDIRIVKNMRICGDCHVATSLI